jgi:hypothetical protein
MDPHHDWQLLSSAVKLRPDHIQVQTILRHSGDVSQADRRVKLTKRLGTGDTRFCRINDLSRSRHIRARWLEPVLAAGILRVRYTIEVLEAIAFNAPVRYIAGRMSDVQRTSRGNCADRDEENRAAHRGSCRVSAAAAAAAWGGRLKYLRTQVVATTGRKGLIEGPLRAIPR